MDSRGATAASVVAYLAAIVAANLSIVVFGPAVAPLNAFVFIGLDLTLRDSIHDRFEHRGLAWRMVLLIATGGLLSWIVNRDAGVIALASTVAFMAAAGADAIAYALLHDRPFLVRANGSNVVSSAVDSAVFPLVAGFGLGLFLPLFAAKAAGGFLWSLILNNAVPVRRRAA